MALIAIQFLHGLYLQWRAVEPIPYSQFQALLKDGQIADLSITDNHITGTLKQALQDGKKAFVTTRVDPALARRTVALLTERRQVLEAAAAELLKKETLSEPDLQHLREILKGYAVPGAHPANE